MVALNDVETVEEPNALFPLDPETSLDGSQNCGAQNPQSFGIEGVSVKNACAQCTPIGESGSLS